MTSYSRTRRVRNSAANPACFRGWFRGPHCRTSAWHATAQYPSAVRVAPPRLSTPFETSAEDGSAIVEFLGLGITLLIPILYGVLSIFSIQSSVMAAHAASAQVVLYVQEQPKGSNVNQGLAQRLAEHAAGDYGVDPSDVSVSLNCSSGECASGDQAYATVTVQARLPLIPSSMGGGVIPVSSYATSWGSGHAEL